ncbi:hypothetical protein PK28_10430 [Hymenobacter sp. DG25B]|nr:hypothetical protein PK28_10430 [Hymenobacter sp. DG25B]
MTGGGLLPACSPTRLLLPGQNLLYKIKLEGVKQANADRLQTLYQQKPNNRFPIPKLAIYQLGQYFYKPDELQRKLQEERTRYDSLIRQAGRDSVTVGKLLIKRERHTRRHQLVLSEGNALMRLGEPPVVYDSTLTERTTEQLSTFLKSQGFFRSSVTARDAVQDRRVTVTYQVTENQPFHYTQLDFDIPDSAVAKVVLENQKLALIHKGDQYSEEAIGLERARLENLLKNAGYFDFRQQYITLEADTSFEPGTVRLRTLIANPAPGERHHIYTIRHVNFLTDAGTNRFGVKRDTVVRDSIFFLAYKHRISSKVLNQRVEVRPGSIYSLNNTQTTQRQLADLDMFRFNTVSYQKVAGDSVNGLHRLDAVVNASPLKKYQETTELGGTVVVNLPGPFTNFRLKVRNVFGGAEVLELGLRAGLEGQIRLGQTAEPGSRIPTAYATQLGANASLILPQFLVPWRTNRFLTRYNPKTRISTSFTYVDRPEYTRTNLEGSYDYIWQRSAYQQYVLTLQNISLVNTSRLDSAYRVALEKLANNGALLRSFGRLLVPSANATSYYNSNDFNQTRDARSFRATAEVGGLGRRLYTRPDATAETTIGGVLVLDYARFNADFRRYHKLTPQTYFVWRLNGGLAHALTPTRFTGENGTTTSYIIPYDKYFFAGGGTSLRAWRPRRLGPGSHTSVVTTNGVVQLDSRGKPIQDENVEQPGELLLEGSAEYRFPLYDYLDGALFTDFGNVWSLQKNDPRPGAQFDPGRFYKEFAVSSGIGFRFDFTFLIIRLDIATKIYDPTAIDGDKWAINRFAIWRNKNKPWQNTPTLNVGIGYPF